MSLYNIEFEYQVDGEDLEGFLPNVEIDDELSSEDQYGSAIFEVKAVYPDATNVIIATMEPV